MNESKSNTLSYLSSSPLVMYLFVNQDLKLTRGQIAAQTSHLTQVITEEIIKDSFIFSPTPSYCMNYMKWKYSSENKLFGTTIVYKATTSQLEKLLEEEKEARFIIDEIPSKTPISTTSPLPTDNKYLTVVGLFPTFEKEKFKNTFSLL